MNISSFTTGPVDTNAFLVSCKETREAVIIDPAPESASLFNNALEQNNLKPRAIWITHSHFDHIADAKQLKDRWDIPLFVHKEDVGNLLQPGSDGLPNNVSIPSTPPDAYFEDGETVSFGHFSFKVIHTPGHSPGSVCLYCEKEQVLFSGDTLFENAIGTLAKETGEPERMWEPLKRLANLPKQTTVYPGHGSTTTIGQEQWIRNAKKYFSKKGVHYGDIMWKKSAEFSGQSSY